MILVSGIKVPNSAPAPNWSPVWPFIVKEIPKLPSRLHVMCIFCRICFRTRKQCKILRPNGTALKFSQCADEQHARDTLDLLFSRHHVLSFLTRFSASIEPFVCHILTYTYTGPIDYTDCFTCFRALLAPKRSVCLQDGLYLNSFQAPRVADKLRPEAFNKTSSALSPNIRFIPTTT